MRHLRLHEVVFLIFISFHGAQIKRLCTCLYQIGVNNHSIVSTSVGLKSYLREIPLLSMQGYAIQVIIVNVVLSIILYKVIILLGTEVVNVL